MYIEGRLKTRSWVDENSITRYQTEIIAEQIQFLGSKNRNNEEGYSDSLAESTPPPSSESNLDDYNNLPF